MQLSLKDVELVHLLNRDYMNKRFEYIETGGMHVPDWDLLHSLVHKLVDKLQVFCARATYPDLC